MRRASFLCCAMLMDQGQTGNVIFRVALVFHTVRRWTISRTTFELTGSFSIEENLFECYSFLSSFFFVLSYWLPFDRKEVSFVVGKTGMNYGYDFSLEEGRWRKLEVREKVYNETLRLCYYVYFLHKLCSCVEFYM